jgi:hypothetical protein
MATAVRAFVEFKFGPAGTWPQAGHAGLWRDGEQVTPAIRPPSEAAIEATIAYCSHIHRHYGRFPAYAAPFRTVIGYQANHVDLEFYDRFFEPDALTETQRTRARLAGDEAPER